MDDVGHRIETDVLDPEHAAKIGIGRKVENFRPRQGEHWWVNTDRRPKDKPLSLSRPAQGFHSNLRSGLSAHMAGDPTASAPVRCTGFPRAEVQH